MKQFALQPTKQRVKHREIIGFDIETVGDDNDFYCVTFAGDGWHKTFFDRTRAIEYLEQSKRIKNGCIIVATNLHFDFFGLFRGTEQIRAFRMHWRGSHLISTSTRRSNGRFTQQSKKSSILFLDTMNYAGLGVEALGKLLRQPKLKKPRCLGRLPINKKERDELVTYNVRDAQISRDALVFFYQTFTELGANIRNTLAGTAMSLFTNKYLEQTYSGQWDDDLREELESYYGGRVEAFTRGTLTGNYHLYDYNSLYPWAMRGEYPDPSSKRVCYGNKAESHIYAYEGYAKIRISIPKMRYPPLPYRYEDKLLFPVGVIEGVWTHIEIREAIKRGCTILRVYKVSYYQRTCEPFKQYVDDLYNLRRHYQHQKSPMEFVCKILMNALYGKFGQKFEARDNIEPLNHTAEQLNKLDYYEIVEGAWLRTKHASRPANFCKPIWASYTTAKARIRLLEGLEQTGAVYCDTDSLLTTKTIPETSALGGLKKEFDAHTCVIVRPKMYSLQGEGCEKIKAKGVGTRMRMPAFYDMIESGKVSYMKFLKFKESLRRHLLVNQKQSMTKHLDLEDTKRSWHEPFNYRAQQDSEPHSFPRRPPHQHTTSSTVFVRNAHTSQACHTENNDQSS